MTTNLDDLPQSSAQSNVQLNISEQNVKIENPIKDLEQRRNEELKQAPLQTTSQTTSQTTAAPQPATAPQGEGNKIDINSFVTGLQQAAANEALQLPSRDIPQSQNHITQDNQMQPNYIPEAKQDYIDDTYNHEKVINKQINKQESINNMDALYDDIHVPIILAVIYFVFQLPVIKTNTLKYIPSLFNKDGNYNVLGYFINSLAFASTYYCVIKSLEYLSV